MQGPFFRQGLCSGKAPDDKGAVVENFCAKDCASQNVDGKKPAMEGAEVLLKVKVLMSSTVKESFNYFENLEDDKIPPENRCAL